MYFDAVAGFPCDESNVLQNRYADICYIYVDCDESKAFSQRPLIRYHTGGYYTNWTIMG